MKRNHRKRASRFFARLDPLSLLVQGARLAAVRKYGIRSEYDSFQIFEMYSNSESPYQTPFREIVKESLTLIKQYDIRRYKMCLSVIQGFADLPSIHFAFYDLHSRMVFNNFAQLDGFALGRQNTIIFLAVTIIHEATHGRIHSMINLRDDRHRMRIERICCDQERHFVGKLRSNGFHVPEDVDWHGLDEEQYNMDVRERLRKVREQMRSL